MAEVSDSEDVSPVGIDEEELTRRLVLLAQELVTATTLPPGELDAAARRVEAELTELEGIWHDPPEVRTTFLGWMARLPHLHARLALQRSRAGLPTSQSDLASAAAARVRRALVASAPGTASE